MNERTEYTTRKRHLGYLAAYVAGAILLALTSQSLIAGVAINDFSRNADHVGPTTIELTAGSPERITGIISTQTALETHSYDREQEPDTVLTLIDRNQPTRLFLDQNFPNPFREHTTIRYGIPQDTWVSVTVHTMLGSPVLTLVNRRQEAGVYNIDVNRHDLMPGLYFYKIETRYGSLTRRLTVSSS